MWQDQTDNLVLKVVEKARYIDRIRDGLLYRVNHLGFLLND